MGAFPRGHNQSRIIIMHMSMSMHMTKLTEFFNAIDTHPQLTSPYPFHQPRKPQPQLTRVRLGWRRWVRARGALRGDLILVVGHSLFRPQQGCHWHMRFAVRTHLCVNLLLDTTRGNDILLGAADPSTIQSRVGFAP